MEELSQQVIYKLGMIEAKVDSGFNGLAKRMDDFCTTSEDQERRIVELEKMKAGREPQVIQFNKALDDIEKLKGHNARLAGAMAIVTVFFTPLIGYFVNHL